MKSSKNFRIFTSLTALMLIFSMAVGITFGWSEGGDRGYVDGNDITITTGSNLTMRQDDKITSSIIIPACTLRETSSKDGRNFFFPLADNTKSETMEMTFREGVPSDVNNSYISVDFELESGDKPVDVYLGAGTIIQCENKELLSALRLAFYYNDGTDPLIFKPNQMPGIEMSYSPIATIEPVSGTPTLVTTPVITESFGSYYYKGDDKSTPLFTLEKEECIHLSLAIWLEGTEFTSADIANSNLDIYIDFTTTVDDLIKYTFIDNCHSRNSGAVNHWVDDNMEYEGVKYDTMMYLYDNTAHRYYALDSQGTGSNTWVGYIPKTINNFYFRRYSIDIDEWWNEWEPEMGNIPTINNERTFIAIAGEEVGDGTNLRGCYGYWKDAYGTFRVYFEMQAPFSNLHCYAWDTSGKACASTGTWPGKGMTFVKNTDNGVLYYIELRESEKVDGIEFNNGGETRVYLDGFNYSSTTSAYAYFNDAETGAEKHPLGDWPGTTADYDNTNTTGHYWVDFTTSSNNDSKPFNIIANDRGSNQYPPSGSSGASGTTGRVLRFSNNNLTLSVLAEPYSVQGTEFDNYIYNGAVMWYKSPTNKGFYVYTDEKDSLIYPNL
ncbi:MAG: starch-binding protein [Ruminococcaceae bacterium]|nr:starch-binding protein [Oscillospiraceae bacterium]